MSQTCVKIVVNLPFKQDNNTTSKWSVHYGTAQKLTQ